MIEGNNDFKSNKKSMKIANYMERSRINEIKMEV